MDVLKENSKFHSMRRKIMAVSKKAKLFSFILTIGFTAVIVSAQDKGEKKADDPKLNPDGTYSSKKYDEAERPEDSYLERFRAIEVVTKLMKENLDNIYLIKVISSNYPDSLAKDDYEKIYNGYKRGMELFYKRNIIYSRVEFEKNKKDIQDLLKKLIQEYKKQSQELLDVCAEKLMLLHLDRQTLSDPNKFDDFHDNQARLRIAYGQYDDALGAEIDHYYAGSIYHFRVAKTYAIKILEALAKTEELDGMKQKFKVHKADNLNRIYEKAKETSAPETKKEEPKK